MSYAHVDVAIVGAGIAGLAAACRAVEHGLSHVVLEAKDRIGGRAHTAVRADVRRWDAGAHWLRQPPINRLIAEADRLGVQYDRQWRPLSLAWQDGEWLSEREANEILHQVDEAEDLAGDLVRISDDATFLELIDPHYAHLPLAEAMLAFDHAASPRQASAVDCKQYGPFDGDWAVSGGFGTFVDQLFPDAIVELGAPVRVVDWGGDPIRVDFGHGLVEADRVLVTVSTAALAGGELHFAPDLPDPIQTSLATLPLGAQEKVSFVADLAAVELEPGSMIHTAEAELPITFYRPPGSDLLVAILSGPAVAGLVTDGADDLIAAALERFGAVFGSAALAAVHDPEATGWLTDPYTAGAASFAMPGAASSRPAFGSGVDGRLFFAGEATSSASFGTAHGAYASGIAALDDIAESLGREVERTWDVSVFGAPSD